MRITGTTTLQAPVEVVYAALIDPAVLAQAIPGCTSMELVGDSAYRMTVHAGVAAIKGAFHSDVQLTCNDGAPRQLTIHASGAGIPGHFSAEISIVLADAPGGSTLSSYTAAVTVGGAIGTLGRYILTRAAKKPIADFLRSFDRILGDTTELIAQH